MGAEFDSSPNAPAEKTVMQAASGALWPKVENKKVGMKILFPPCVQVLACLELVKPIK